MTHDTEILREERQRYLQRIRFWLFWVLLLAALAYGINRYFAYRIQELDRRLELLGSCHSCSNEG